MLKTCSNYIVLLVIIYKEIIRPKSIQNVLKIDAFIKMIKILSD